VRGPGGERRPENGREESDARAPTREDGEQDAGKYKVCQFFLHKFSADLMAPEVKTASTSPKEQTNSDMIQEMQEAFSGFFEPDMCDAAFNDNNLDICEAAYKLACDAQENRFKLSMPLTQSVLLCESLVISDRNEHEIVVSDDALLQPTSLYAGKWILNGDSLAYHSNLMQSQSVVHVFSTNPVEEKPLPPTPALSRTTSRQPKAGRIGLGYDEYAGDLPDDGRSEEDEILYRQMLLEQRHLEMDGLDEEERQIHLRQQEISRFIDRRDKAEGEKGKDDQQKDEK
jgi:hypothetical protein